jgi:MOSC domain-containing protein YiiM
MEVVSVNVGTPRRVAWKGMTVETGIFKDPVDGPVAIGTLNLAGDRQADLTVHGGPEKAVYAYPAEHYRYWEEELPKVALSWGEFGENLTTAGLSEASLFIGDQLKVGSATLMVTQPRLPCYKLALKFNRDDMIKRFLVSRRSGFYLSVVQAGEVSAHSPIEFMSRDPNRISVTDISRLYFSKEPDPDLLQRVANLSALPQSWRDDLAMRAQRL